MPSDPPLNGAPNVDAAEVRASLMMLRRGSRDMAALLALPAMWADRSPSDITADVLNVLFAMLALESGYVRFDSSVGAVQSWRPTGPEPPSELERLLAAIGEPRGAQAPSSTAAEVDGYRVISISRSFLDERGFVLVSCRDSDFPTELELYLLGMVLSQAAVAIHTARKIALERSGRLAAEEALRLRTEFLARLSEDLTSSLLTLSERATQAAVLAQDGLQPSSVGGWVASDRVESLAAGAPNAIRRLGLTQREVEVLGLLGQGLSNKEIAGVMWLSDRTVERHITSLYRKLRVGRRSEATAVAMRYGLVVDSDGRLT